MQSYSPIIGIIELRNGGVGYRTIKKRCNIGNSTVTLIMKRFHELRYSLDELKVMSPKAIKEAFYPPENLCRSDKELPDFFKIYQQMLSMDTLDSSLVWMEYKKENPNGYQLSQFYKLYGDFLKKNFGQDPVSMPVECIPGERMYTDWVGDQPELLTDPSTGEVKKVHVFATTLGFSNCVYAEVFAKKLPSFITGVVHALEYYGAVPKYLVPDNLKTAISMHSKDELSAVQQSISFAEIKLPAVSPDASSVFHPDLVIRRGKLVLEISNSVSSELLSRIGGIFHAE